jgi:proteasome lid subunit RPN8/RPN11
MRSKGFAKSQERSSQLKIPYRKQYLARLQSDFKKKAFRPPKSPPHPDLIENMRMTTQVYQDIKATIGSRPAESGGLLMSDTRDYTITCFVLDIAAAKNSSVYQPDTVFLNSVLKGRNDEFVGIVHSHPRGVRYLTTQDQRAAWSNLTSAGNPHLNAYLMPLIQTIPDTGRFEIIPYIVTCCANGNGRVEVCRVELEIIG